jgi:hypothetical protein
VTLCDPVEAPFEGVLELTRPDTPSISVENTVTTVCICKAAETETKREAEIEDARFVEIELSEVHVDDVGELAPNLPNALTSELVTPKLDPTTVTEAAPVAGPLAAPIELGTGRSKLSISECERWDTAAETDRCRHRATPDDAFATIEESETHFDTSDALWANDSRIERTKPSAETPPPTTVTLVADVVGLLLLTIPLNSGTS